MRRVRFTAPYETSRRATRLMFSSSNAPRALPRRDACFEPFGASHANRLAHDFLLQSICKALAPRRARARLSATPFRMNRVLASSSLVDRPARHGRGAIRARAVAHGDAAGHVADHHESHGGSPSRSDADHDAIAHEAIPTTRPRRPARGALAPQQGELHRVPGAGADRQDRARAAGRSRPARRRRAAAPGDARPIVAGPTHARLPHRRPPRSPLV
jgi:hypothetical protein